MQIRARHDRRVSRRALITRRRISRRTRRARRVRQRRVVRRRRIHRATHHPRPRLPRRKRLPTHDHATREGAAVRREVRIVALHPADLLTHTRTSQHLRAQHITHTHTRRIRRAIVRHRQRVLHAIPSHHTATHNRRTQRHNRVRHMQIRARHDRRVSRRALITRRRISRRTRRARRVRQRRVVRRRRIHRATHHPRPRLPRRKRLPTHDHATREGAAVRREVRIVALHPADLLTHTRTSQHLRAQHITHTHTRRIRRAIVRHRQRVLHAIPSHHTATHNRRTQRHNRVRHMQIRSSVGDGNRETVPRPTYGYRLDRVETRGQSDGRPGPTCHIDIEGIRRVRGAVGNRAAWTVDVLR